MQCTVRLLGRPARSGSLLYWSRASYAFLMKLLKIVFESHTNTRRRKKNLLLSNYLQDDWPHHRLSIEPNVYNLSFTSLFQIYIYRKTMVSEKAWFVLFKTEYRFYHIDARRWSNPWKFQILLPFQFRFENYVSQNKFWQFQTKQIFFNELVLCIPSLIILK